MADEARRYSFSPLERRGLLLGLTGGQLATMGLGLLGAFAALRAVPGPIGDAGALGSVVGGTAAAVRKRAGQPLASWVPIWLQWRNRHGSGPVLSAEPLGGQTVAGRANAVHRSTSFGREAPRDLRGIRIVDLPVGPGSPSVGVVHDRRTGLLSAAVAVEGRALALMDPADQAGRLESWRAVLCGLARPGSPLRRVQWVQQGGPAGAAGYGSDAGFAADRGLAGETGGPVESYAELLAESASALRSRSAWLVLAVGAARGVGRSRPAGRNEIGRDVEALLRELRLLDGRLRAADLRAGLPLPGAAIGGLIASGYQLDRPEPTNGSAGAHRGGTRWAWPLAYDEQWSALRTDETWHATYWVSEWPRVDVGPGFLGPLLLSETHRSVAVVMSPVPGDRAMRDARAANRGRR